MKRYKVFINGTNFLVKLDRQAKKLGFYTTRFVRAPDARAAYRSERYRSTRPTKRPPSSDPMVAVVTTAA